MKNRRPTLIRIGRNIQIRMDEVGMTEYQLAIQTGFPVNTIKTWLRGEAYPKGAKLDALAKALHTQPINIVAGKYNP